MKGSAIAAKRTTASSRRVDVLAIAACLTLGVAAIARAPGDEDKGADVRSVAAKRAADYAAARQRCDVFAGEVKINCVTNARALFDRQ